MLQTERRRDPYPFTWEIPVGAATMLLLLGIVGVHLGRGLARMVAGAGWAWPTSRNLFSSLPGVLAGDSRAGLTDTSLQISHSSLLVWIVAVELLLLAGALTVTVWGLRRWGPNRMKGMASAAEAETILGVSRLRKVARIIRPDLYAPNPATTNGDHDGYHPGS